MLVTNIVSRLKHLDKFYDLTWIRTINFQVESLPCKPLHHWGWQNNWILPDSFWKWFLCKNGTWCPTVFILCFFFFGWLVGFKNVVHGNHGVFSTYSKLFNGSIFLFIYFIFLGQLTLRLVVLKHNLLKTQ